MLNAHFKTIARRAKMSDRLALHVFAWLFRIINHQPRYYRSLGRLINDTWGWAGKDGIGLRLTQCIELAGHRLVM